MNVQNANPAPVEDNVSIEELSAARTIYTSMLLACKKLSLYPHGHNICMDSINHFYSQLASFLKGYGTYRLEIERERVAFKGQAISSGMPEEGTPHFILFRDGIKWLEFIDGIEEQEIDRILRIFNGYGKLSAEPEGDIVTAFWEAQFPHLQYEVAAFSWGGFEDSGEGVFCPATEKSSSGQFREKNLEKTVSISEPLIDHEHLSLTIQEQERLKKMIVSEEEADLTSYLDALLDTLLQHREKENFTIVLEVLSEEFKNSLVKKDFPIALKILEGLQHVQTICDEDAPWACRLIEEFSTDISCPDSLGILKDSWKKIGPEDAEILKRIFQLLDGQAIQTLASLLVQPQPQHLRQVIFDSIIFLASQDIRHLESILFNSDEKLTERLVPLITAMEGGQTIKYLMKLARHPSVRVRHEAITHILKKEAVPAKHLFSLLPDKDASIRKMVLERLGQSRDAAVEDLFMEYLQNEGFNDGDEDHVLQCFKTLGKCGSSRCVPFLGQSLCKRPWLLCFRRPVNRRGAAAALARLGISESEKILNAAGKSLFPGLRSLVRKAREELKQEKGYQNV
jgi:hypothetical protein